MRKYPSNVLIQGNGWQLLSSKVGKKYIWAKSGVPEYSVYPIYTTHELKLLKCHDEVRDDKHLNLVYHAKTVFPGSKVIESART